MSHKKTLAAAVAAFLLFIVSAPAWATDALTAKAGKTDLGHDGVASAFAGVIDGRSVMAGGSDFTGLRPWEGGSKSYFDDVVEIVKTSEGYVARPTGVKLPKSLAGGAGASDGKVLYCFGGSNAEGQSRTVYSVKVSGNSFAVDAVTELPDGFIPAAAVYSGGKFYVHGTAAGQNKLYAFDPVRKSWAEKAACPDRLLFEGSSMAEQHNGRENAVYLIGGRGTDSQGLYVSSSIWEYLPVHDTWSRKYDFAAEGVLEGIMYPAVAKYGSAHVLIIGGDDGVEMRRRLELDAAAKSADSEELADSLNAQLAEAFKSHAGFIKGIYAYHTITGTVVQIGSVEDGLPACSSALVTGGKILVPSGEAHPGVRSSDIYEITVQDKVSFGWINYTVIILYLLGMLGVGFYFSKKAKNTDQFFKGGGNIPWWAAGISIFATALSAITFLSIPAKAYMADWGMFMFNMTIILVAPVIIKYYLPFFRKLSVASVYQYLETRFSSSVSFLASLFFTLFMFARVAIVLFLPSLALNAVTGLNIYFCIILMGLVTMAYCTMGGIEAVVWGDVIQGCILVFGALLSLGFLIFGVDGGLGEVMRVAIDDKKFNILDFSFDWTKPVFWVALIGGFSNTLLTYSSDQSVVQRYITTKDTSSTKKSIWLNGILSIPITIIFFSIGTGLYVFFKKHPDMLNVSMTNTDSIFPHFIMCELPVGVAGLLIAAIFAAAMSTLSSNINSASTVMTEDFYSKLRPKATDGDKMRFARWTGIILGVFGIVMACALAVFPIASLWDQFNFFLGLLTSGLGGLFMMGIFTKRIGARAALTGFFGSIVIVLLFHSMTNVAVILYGFIGLAACFIIGYLTSFVYGYNK